MVNRFARPPAKLPKPTSKPKILSWRKLYELISAMDVKVLEKRRIKERYGI